MKQVVCRRVHDGDSIFVEDAKAGLRYWLRLRSIDTPEVYAPGYSVDQPFGREVGDTVRDWLKGQKLSINITGRDKYGRRLADVFWNDEHVNKTLVRSGHAWAISSIFQADQDYAKSLGLGFWSVTDPAPVRPSRWRAMHKNLISRETFNPNMWADEKI